jgi:hypothetical protein
VRDARLTAPGYLPEPARTLVPWARSAAAKTARRYGVALDDCFDEAIAALLRAGIHFKSGSGTFRHYAQIAVRRALWRYVARPRRLPTVALDDPHVTPQLRAPSAEEDVLAREAAARALLLRQHAELAEARADRFTARRLRAAATVATRTARGG